MTSFFAQLYLELVGEIKTKVPEITFIDQNLGQYFDDEWRRSISTSKATLLIDFPDTSYTNLQGTIQTGNAMVRFVLMFPAYSQSYGNAPLEVQQKALDYYEIEHKLCTVLHKIESDIHSGLIRSDAKSQNVNEFGLRIREINFRTSFEDFSTDEDVRHELTFSFNGQINPPT